MYWTSLLFSLLAVPACQALPSQEKRGSAVSAATLYAYGTNISSFPVYYDHTTTSLYVVQSNTTSGALSAITWDIPALSEATTTSTAGTLANGTSVGGIWVDTANNLFDQVLVLNNATTGFGAFGKQLVYYNGTSVASEFWAKEVSQSDGTTVWSLHWNSNNDFRSGSVPVVLKTTASASS